MVDKQTDVGEVMDYDTLKSLYQTNSVDKDAFWKIDRETGSVLAVPLQDTAVYNGGAFTQYLTRTGQAFAGVFAPIPGGTVAAIGAQIRDKGAVGAYMDFQKRTVGAIMPGLTVALDAVDAAGFVMGFDVEDKVDRFIGEKLSGSYEAHMQKSELIGEKMVNYGLYMSDVGKNIIAEMEAQQPVDNKVSKFLGDATGSILATVGLYYLGGTPLTIGVFGASSGLEVSTEALRVGKDADTALAAGILVGVAVSGLENLGLKSIFGNTARSGIKAAANHILTAMATEGITEALQELVEIGGSYAVGGQARQMTVLDVLSQMTYAGAVGAFSGGAMVGGVTVVQRHKAVSLMQQALGVDRGTAKTIVQGAEQAAMEDIFSKTGEDTGYDAIQNKKFQNMRDLYKLAQGEVGVSNEAMQKLFESLNLKTAGEQLLDKIRAQAIADVNAQIEEGKFKGMLLEDKHEE